MKLWGLEGYPACLSRGLLLPNSAFIPWPHAPLWIGTCQEFPWGMSSGWVLRLHQSFSGRFVQQSAQSATMNGEERFASKAQSWSEQEHGAGMAADCLTSCALHSQCHGPVHALVASSWGFHHHGQGLVLPWWYCMRVEERAAVCEENFKPGNVKDTNEKNKNGPSQTKTEICYIMNFLQCQQLSPSRVPWAHLQGQGEVGWQCCHCLQTSCGDQAVSSAWCFLLHPLPPAAMKRHIPPPQTKPSENRKLGGVWRNPRHWVPPSSLPVASPCINMCPQWSYSAGNSTQTSHLPGAGEQLVRAGKGSVSFWGTSNLQPAHGGVRPLSKLLYADVAFTQYSSFALFIIFQGRANHLNSSNSSQFKTE